MLRARPIPACIQVDLDLTSMARATRKISPNTINPAEQIKAHAPACPQGANNMLSARLRPISGIEHAKSQWPGVRGSCDKKFDFIAQLSLLIAMVSGTCTLNWRKIWLR